MPKVPVCANSKSLQYEREFLNEFYAKYLNILIGDTAVLETMYVLDCSIVETVNQQVVTMKTDDALKLDIQRHNFVLLLSDVAFHDTCMVHLLHNCAEEVRRHFQQIDNFIAKVKRW